MIYYYAQVNSDAICYAVLQTYAEIVQTNMISIPAYDESYLGMEWTGSEWITPPPPEPPA
jgi:hypothetical protein